MSTIGQGPSSATTLRIDSNVAAWGPLFLPHRPIVSLWKNRAILKQFSLNALAEGHRGSLLGPAWVVLDPLILLAVYSFVFGLLLNQGSAAGGPLAFTFWLYAGILAYQVFSLSASLAPSVINNAATYVTQMVFPIEMLPVSCVGGVMIPSLIGFGLLTIFATFLGAGLHGTMLLLPVVLLPILLLSVGMSWLLGSIGVFIPDTRKIVSALTQVLFFMTPIVWQPSQIPAGYQWVLTVNPLAPMIQNIRLIMLDGQMPSWPSFTWTTLFSLVIFQLGYALFMRSKRAFADVL